MPLLMMLALCSCAGGSGAASLLLLALALVLGACRQEPTRALERDELADAGGLPREVDPRDASEPPPVIGPGDGHWERCCRDGREEQCWCPGPTSCNFAWSCIDAGVDDITPDLGTTDVGRADLGRADLGGADLGSPDLGGGRWEPCCQNGVISTCYCPEGAICNYGWFNDCGDDTCVVPPRMCER